MTNHITNQTFQTEVLEEDKPVLLDFYAEWCGPCKMLAPVLEEVGRENDNVKICKVNVDEEPELAEKFRVMSIPTLVVMKEGVPVRHVVGVQGKKEILSMLEL